MFYASSSNVFGIELDLPYLCIMICNNELRAEICAVISEIPVGRVLTYGDIARLVGLPSHARLVGRMLAAMPSDCGVPCHRVVDVCGRTAPCWREQRLLLEAEGVVFRPCGCVDMKRCRWMPI